SSSSDEEVEEADDDESAAGGAKGFCAAKAVAAAIAAAAAFAPTSATPSAAEGSSGSEGAGRDSIAAGRQGVLRLYGAVLIKLRVSVFLFCSAAAAEGAEAGQQRGERGANEGSRERGGSRQGPSELTLRRQGVMSGENLDAVAAYLQARRGDVPGARGHGHGDTEGAAGAESPAPAGVGGTRARDWMRAEVGRAALCSGRGGGGAEGAASSAGFSTRVAALLLSRSGERGRLAGTSASSSGSGSSSGSSALYADEGAVAEGSRDRGRSLVGEEPKTAAAKAAARPAGGDGTAASVALALAEAQFRRDPWPEADLPRASEQAARMFLPRQGGGNRPGDSGAGSSATATTTGVGGGGGSGSGATGGPSAESVGDRNALGGSTVSGHGGSEYDPSHPCPPLPPSPPPSCREATAAVSGRKRKRRSEPGGGRGRSSCSPPPHYTGLLGQLPRDSRNLLARLGHQGYVKVLEGILDGFLRDSNAASNK
ncbi:unnamed protein product, partial [Scytosiphon promiscuus]